MMIARTDKARLTRATRKAEEFRQKLIRYKKSNGCVNPYLFQKWQNSVRLWRTTVDGLKKKYRGVQAEIDFSNQTINLSI